MTVLPDVWERVIGQPEVMAQLELAAVDPVHAYLFLGVEGWGTHRAARAFSALILSADAAASGDMRAVERARRLALAGLHPDGIEFRPVGSQWSVDEIKEIIRTAVRTPNEASRKVIIMPETESMDLNAIGRLLKVVEEPPASTVFVLLADEPPAEFTTIASRCVNVRFRPIGVADVEAALLAEGYDDNQALVAASASGGDLSRALLVAQDPGLAIRAGLWRSVPDRINGTGAVVYELVAQLREGLNGAQEPLDDRQGTELEDLEVRVEQFGERGSGRQALVGRHKREIKRLRDDELRFGFGIMARIYRDRYAQGDTSAVVAIDAIQQTSETLGRTVNEALLLERLLCRLPSRN